MDNKGQMGRGTLRDSQTVGSAEYNASDTMITAISDTFGIIVLIVVFAVVLGLVALFDGSFVSKINPVVLPIPIIV